MTAINLVGNTLTGSTGTGKFVGDTAPSFTGFISLPNDPGAFPAASIVGGPFSSSGAVALISTGDNANQNNGSGIGYYLATGVLGSNFQTSYIWQRWSGTGNGGTFIISKGRGTSANPIVYDFTFAVANSNGAGTVAIGTTSQTSNEAIIYGVTDASDAPAGIWQEYISSTVAIGSAVSLTTATAKTITSISLTAGDWDIWGNIGIIPDSGTLVTNIESSISTTTNTLATSPNGGGYFKEALDYPASVQQVNPIGRSRFIISSTTTYYLVASATFSVSTCSAYGFIGARRRY